MRVAILGTRGIPNYHGGFEQFAEFFAKYLVENGHEVVVYCSSLHPYQSDNWNGVQLVHKKDPEDKIGTFGQFIYDLNCIIDSRSRNFDVILQLGYTSSSVWHWLLPKKAKIVTNMDGLEWKRSKYNKWVQKFLKVAETLAVNHSDVLVADSYGIQKYLREEYKVDSKYIAYGVEPIGKYDDQILEDLNLKKENYHMLVARMEPENNIEVILDGMVKSKSKKDFIVVGKTVNGFGAYLVKKFGDVENIRFVGGIYDLPKLNSLRKNADLYFHGHSVGGTNPSLLEAMASHTLICANKNIFNESILKGNAFYFSSDMDVADLIRTVTKSGNQTKVMAAYDDVVKNFSWLNINKQYMDLICE